MSKGIQFQDTRIPTSAVLEKIIHDMKAECITLRDIMAMLGEQGLLLICALMSLPFLFPVSIPGVSTVFGAGIVLIAFAITINRLPWLPDFLANKQLETEKLIPVLLRGVRFLRRIDRFLKPRFALLTTGGLINRVNGLALMLSGLLLMMPLGLVPFSNTLPGFAVLLLSTGISQRDGVLVAIGYGFILATILYFGILGYGFYAAGNSLFGAG